MPGFDVMNGLTGFDPIVFIIGLGIIWLIGRAFTKRDK